MRKENWSSSRDPGLYCFSSIYKSVPVDKLLMQ